MYLSLSKNESSDQKAILAATLAQTFFGKFPGNDISIHKEPVSGAQFEITPVASDMGTALSADKSSIFVAFQIGDGHDGKQALGQYVQDRQPVLEKHGGRVFLSALTPRTKDWSFDGIELIEFPRPDTVQSLMADADYRKRTASSSAVFSGDFAMAILASPAK
ncbi:MAG: hypothetical protein RL748_2690 [Pseudomonadota bacterium]|jgi:uncharacterized protein (DUF1330 family)